jgi:phage tail sheath gpL-like
MSRKGRPPASVDAHLLHAAEAAAAAGRGPSLGVSVDDALEHDRRLEVLAELIAEHEAEHGEITDAEMRAAAHKMGARTIPVRGRAPARKPAR